MRSEALFEKGAPVAELDFQIDARLILHDVGQPDSVVE